MCFWRIVSKIQYEFDTVNIKSRFRLTQSVFICKVRIE